MADSFKFHPQFKEAVDWLEAIHQQEGPRSDIALCRAVRLIADAPAELQPHIRAKAVEMGLLPPSACTSADGALVFYDAATVAQHLGVPIDEFLPLLQSVAANDADAEGAA